MSNLINRNSLWILLVTVSLLAFSACGTRKVQNVTNETEANEILDMLLTYGVSALKIESTERNQKVFEIHVAGSDEEYRAAIQLMEDHCLPDKLPPEIKSDGLVTSPTEERARETRRIKINVESQLRKLPGATCVDVNLVKPETKSLGTDPVKASATVLLRHKTEKFGNSKTEISEMVAGAVPGLEAEEVKVTLTRKDLRPLPDFRAIRNNRRLQYVVIGAVSTLTFFIIVVLFLRRWRKSSEALVHKEST